MRTIVFIIVIVFGVKAGAKTITDMVGRSVTIPDNIERVLPYDSKLSIFLFPMADDLMVARAILPGTKKFKFLSDAYNRIPEVDIKNLEEVLTTNTQIIIGGAYADKEGYEKFDKLQKRTGIPVVVIDLSVDKLDESYRFLGSILGIKDEAVMLSGFITTMYKKVNELKECSSKQKPSVYYTIGGSGLMTDPPGSRHTEVLDYMGIDNVAKVPIPTGGHANVNLEQVLAWNPDYILCAGFKGNKNAFEAIKTDSRWKGISAVINNKVYKVPTQPFGWFDHPPSVNRIPGIIWMAEIFYGMDKTTSKSMITEFYQLFYKYELTEQEYQMLF